MHYKFKPYSRCEWISVNLRLWRLTSCTYFLILHYLVNSHKNTLCALFITDICRKIYLISLQSHIILLTNDVIFSTAQDTDVHYEYMINNWYLTPCQPWWFYHEWIQDCVHSNLPLATAPASLVSSNVAMIFSNNSWWISYFLFICILSLEYDSYRSKQFCNVYWV